MGFCRCGAGITGDEIAGATGVDVKLRAERKLGCRAEALAPQSPRLGMAWGT